MTRCAGDDERGEALPAAILFLGVFLTILIGIHVVLVSMARAAVQSAADRALAAAQAADPGEAPETEDCDQDGSPDSNGVGERDTVRECAGILEAQVAMIGASGSVLETRLPAVVVQEDRGTVTVLVFGGVISPVLGGIELTGRACGPLDDAGVAAVSSPDMWRC